MTKGNNSLTHYRVLQLVPFPTSLSYYKREISKALAGGFLFY